MEAGKIFACFVVSILISLALANLQAYDSAHVSAQIKGDKSSVAKPLKRAGAEEYKIAVTGTYTGAKRDIRIELAGEPAVDYEIYSMYPPPLQLRDWYSFEGNVIRGISSGDKFRLFLVLRARSGSYNLTFFDAHSGKPLLTVPIGIGEEASAHVH